MAFARFLAEKTPLSSSASSTTTFELPDSPGRRRHSHSQAMRMLSLAHTQLVVGLAGLSSILQDFQPTAFVNAYSIAASRGGGRRAGITSTRIQNYYARSCHQRGHHQPRPFPSANNDSSYDNGGTLIEISLTRLSSLPRSDDDSIIDAIVEDKTAGLASCSDDDIEIVPSVSRRPS